MPKLFKINAYKYVWLDHKGVEFEGDEFDILVKMINQGVPHAEAAMGIEALDSDHDVAHFGINRMFIYSKKLKESA